MKEAKNKGINDYFLTPQSVVKFKDGDHSEFSRIYSCFQGELLAFVRRWIFNPETAEDLLQEVFVRTFRFRSTYDPDLSLRSWLRAIARNTITDWLRSHRSRLPLSHAENSIDITEVRCTLPSAEILLAKKQSRLEVESKMRKLTLRQQKILWMRVSRGLSYDEIALELGVSLSAVKTCLHRARLAFA